MQRGQRVAPSGKPPAEKMSIPCRRFSGDPAGIAAACTRNQRSPPCDRKCGRSRRADAACLCQHRGKPLLWLVGCCKPYWEWTSFPRGNTVLLPGSPAKLPHTFFENPMACAPYSVNLMGARTRRHASAMDAVPHPLPSVMFPTVPGLSGVMPAKEIPLSDIVVWYTCSAVFPMGP